jgi:hypothetical protein
VPTIEAERDEKSADDEKDMQTEIARISVMQDRRREISETVGRGGKRERMPIDNERSGDKTQQQEIITVLSAVLIKSLSQRSHECRLFGRRNCNAV